ncbi:beta-lactamase [Emticicia oligotrophica DSM 17448]|uniref:Beta-lactamase n=1 Tax=Emticicia oligotrophica (strain DSM 17448 / CIP 109782 / MTCC 6937 / GPTSA100-15) TaxID=929562 RepID=A0ABN4AQF3_EMTOG|nr:MULTISPECIES: MBL fold metallo-hydrolase [Emticicia]AFK04613.1 beta-lactamase [Emticicia oligotrophica DSM 17448]
MQVTFLGTGTSGGIPVLTCGCEVCNSLDYRDKRLRVSVWIEVDNKSFVIDTGPDFRQQALRERIPHIDGVIYTHEHKDHTAGMDDIRPYNYLHGIQHLDIFGHPRVLNQLKREFAYAFDEQKYPGVPLINVHEIENKPFSIKGVDFLPIEVLHHRLPVLGYRVNDFTYITDVNFISEEELEKVYGTKVLVLGALQRQKHISHFTLEEAIEVAQKVNAETTYLTHISHKMGFHSIVEQELPSNIRLAYDGLKIKL